MHSPPKNQSTVRLHPNRHSVLAPDDFQTLRPLFLKSNQAFFALLNFLCLVFLCPYLILGQNSKDEQMNFMPNEQIDFSKDVDLLARKCAFDMLTQILERKSDLDLTLDTNKDFISLDSRDRGFVRMMLATTLRRLGQIDDLIAFAQDRPDSLKTPAIRNILRLGVTQLFFMDVPDHASVDTAVRLAEIMGMDRQKGFVNAILRKLSREGSERIKKQDESRLNTPEWLLKIWIRDYGLNTASQIARSHLSEAPLDITLLAKESSFDWANALQASELKTGTLRRKQGGNIRDLEGFHQGKWWVQDAAAAIPATLFDDIRGQKVIDLCAAPGGKTLQLASMGAHVIAIDRSAKRLTRLEENVHRMGLQNHVSVEVADAVNWHPKEAPQYILLDAPCSATGTIRRHPDNPHLKSPKDIERLCTIQERILNRAGEILAVGGTMIYCTCSLQKDEGERQIDRFLARHPNYMRIPVRADEIGGYDELINDQGDLRILPSMLAMHGGLDGFFVSRLTRTK